MYDMDSSGDSFVWTSASSDSDSLKSNNKIMEQENCKIELESECIHDELLSDLTESKKRKKAKKRRREESSESSEQLAKKFLKWECEKEINKSLSNVDDKYLDLRIKEEEINSSELETKKTKKKKKHKEINEILKNNTLDKSNFNNIVNGNPDGLIKENINHNSVQETISQKGSRISERLTFEGDNSIYFDQTVPTLDANGDLQSSGEIKNFQSLNKHLSLSKLKDFIFQSDDEEEWILNCSPDIDIMDFKNIELEMDVKKKIKIGGKTYDRTIDLVDCIAEVTFRNQRAVLNHKNAVEVHNYRKRIPKPHVPVEGVMINKQTNFIPLPDTKVRHPLFGTDYKKAIKVRKTIVQRLHPPDIPVVIKAKKNKHIKERTKVEEEIELETNIPTSVEPAGTSKKKNKHKKERTKVKEELELKANIPTCAEPAGTSKKKHKHKKERTEVEEKFKLEANIPTSAETVGTSKKEKKRKRETEETPKKIKMEAGSWETETAIEKKLFNF